MAIKRYRGSLGQFEYDSNLFKHCSYSSDAEYLYYIGKETDGSKIKIPEGITDCSNMFEGCRIETPPIIPDGVTICDDMFMNCCSLKVPPIIPDSATSCYGMFYLCVSLETPPIIPDNVKDCIYMFGNCSEYVKLRGGWQIEHRGLSFDESLRKYERYIPKSLMDDVTKFDELCYIMDVGNKYEESGKHTAYEQVLEGVLSGILTTADDIKHEMEIADKVFARKVTVKRNVDLTGDINPSQDAQLNLGDTKYGYTTL